MEVTLSEDLGVTSDVSSESLHPTGQNPDTLFAFNPSDLLIGGGVVLSLSVLAFYGALLLTNSGHREIRPSIFSRLREWRSRESGDKQN